MSFLAPLLLAGLLAVGLPILLHLRKQRPKENLLFSSLMFLEESTPVTKSRTRLQNILLLILRCLAIALLAFAFSRPFFSNDKDTVNGEEVLHYLLIDTSASMRGEPLKEAVEFARKLIENCPEKDRVAIATFSKSLQQVISPETARRELPANKKSNALDLLKTIEADWNSANLDLALISAKSTAGEDSLVQIHLISDLQSGSNMERLTDEFWSNNFQVITHDVALKENWTNAGVYVVPSGKMNPKVRVINAAGSTKSDFSLMWEGGEAVQVHVEPGESAIFEAPLKIANKGEVILKGDDYEFDNKSTWVQPVPPIANIYYPLIENASDSNEESYYVNRALQNTRNYTVAFSSELPIEVPTLTLTSGETEISEILKNGGNVLYTMRDASSVDTLAKLWKLSSLEAKEANVRDFVLFGEIDFKSSVFQAFSDARYADFSRMHIWKYRVLPEELVSRGNVLASFDNGDPAWIEFNFGKGKLHVLTTTWRPVDSQIALTTKFPPLLHSLLSRGLKMDTTPSYSLVGEFHDTPGVHLEEGKAVSVLLDPDESQLLPLKANDFRTAGLPIDPSTHEQKKVKIEKKLSDIDLESRQRIGWWLLLAVALFIIVETTISAFPSLTTKEA